MTKLNAKTDRRLGRKARKQKVERSGRRRKTRKKRRSSSSAKQLRLKPTRSIPQRFQQRVRSSGHWCLQVSTRSVVRSYSTAQAVDASSETAQAPAANQQPEFRPARPDLLQRFESGAFQRYRPVEAQVWRFQRKDQTDRQHKPARFRAAQPNAGSGLHRWQCGLRESKPSRTKLFRGSK